MNKLQLSYLRQAVNIAINTKESGMVPSYLCLLRSYKTPVYAFIREVVGDARFYGVLENEPFYRRYGVARVSEFIDTIPKGVWRDEYELFERKEEFLASWYMNHIKPYTDEEKRKIDDELREKGIYKSEYGEPGEIGLAIAGLGKSDLSLRTKYNDCTNNKGGYTTGALPGEAYLYDAQSRVAEKAQEDLGDGESDRGGENGGGADKQTLSFGRGEGALHKADAIFLNRIEPSIYKLAKMIGRVGQSEHTESKGRFSHSRTSDISGVTVGNDLSSLLPAELAMLGSRTTENIFYQRYSQKRLQIFSSGSHSVKRPKEKTGPIFMCIDTSSSMSGAPEILAKTLALAIAIVAQQKRRPMIVVNYSWDLSFFVLRNIHAQRQSFLSFLSQSYAGGNNEDMLFNFVFDDLPKLPEYRRFKNQFEGADLLVVSDYIWAPLNDKTLELIEEARDGGMKYYGLMINEAGMLDPERPNDFFDGGLDFFNDCDHQFIAQNGHCKEYKPQDKNKYNAKNETTRRHSLRAGVARLWHDYR